MKSCRRHNWSRLTMWFFAVMLVATSVACAGNKEKEEPAEDQVKEAPAADEGSEQDDESSTDAAADADSTEDREASDSSASSSSDSSNRRRTRRGGTGVEAAIDEARVGDRKQALNQLEEHLDGEDGYLAAYNMAIIHESEGATRKAAQRYQTALEKNADFSPALLNLVRLYLRNNQASDADSISRKYMNAQPENMSHRAAHLEVSLHKGQYEETIRSAKNILRRDETNVDAMLAMAEANMELERFELARAILDRAVELEPERAEIYFKYGLISDQEGKVSAAIEGYENAIQRRPDYPEAHNNLGVLYHDATDYDSALEEFNEAIRWAPTFKEAYLNKGNALKGKGSFQEAARTFNKALEIDPKYADAVYNLGILYLDSDFEGMDTIPELRKSIEYFEKYKSIKSSRLSQDDPANNYLQEAKKAIEVEEKRQEMMRQQQQEP